MPVHSANNSSLEASEVALLSWPAEGLEDMTNLPVNWDALTAYAVNLRRRQWRESRNAGSPPFSSCVLLPKHNFGGLHVVRIIEFDDRVLWIARLQKQFSSGIDNVDAQRLTSEMHTLLLIRERTNIKVPDVIGFEASVPNPVGVPFSLLSFVPGDTMMDHFADWHGAYIGVPKEIAPHFNEQVAGIHVDMASLRFPKIGSVVRLDDGSYTVGPLPGLGGPFSTAADFFQAWGSHDHFSMTTAQMSTVIPKSFPKLWGSIQEFPARLAAIAEFDGSLFAEGPFPLHHPDFYHSNIIVDKETGSNVLVVIDWDGATTIPWEMYDFPQWMSLTPPPMDHPNNLDEDGEPCDPDALECMAERERYVRLVRLAEAARGGDTRLSSVLASRNMQNLAHGLKMYLNPKIGLYCKILEKAFPHAWERLFGNHVD